MAIQVLKKLTFLDSGPLSTSSKRSGLQKPGSSNQEEDEEEALVSSEDKEIIEASLGSYWGFTGVARGLAGVALGSRNRDIRDEPLGLEGGVRLGSLKTTIARRRR